MNKYLIIIPAASLLLGCEKADPSQQYAQECAENYINGIVAELDASVISVTATNVRKVPDKDIVIHDIDSEIFSNKTNTAIKLPKKDFTCYTSQEAYQEYQQRVSSEIAARKAEQEKRNKAKQERIRLAAEESEKRRQENIKREKKRKKHEAEKIDYFKDVMPFALACYYVESGRVRADKAKAAADKMIAKNHGIHVNFIVKKDHLMVYRGALNSKDKCKIPTKFHNSNNINEECCSSDYVKRIKKLRQI